MTAYSGSFSDKNLINIFLKTSEETLKIEAATQRTSRKGLLFVYQKVF